MKAINPTFKILYPATAEDVQEMYKRIELAGRTCYKSEDKITEDSAKKFITGLIKCGHEAMIEHANMTVRFTVDRGVSHEIVRHRIASYAQESTRYCVAGDTLLTYSNPHVHMTVSELYDNMVNSGNGSWKRISIRQYDEKNGELCFAKPAAVFYNGKKRCVRIRTSLGYELTCTPEHKILTPHGYVCACDIDAGDQVFVNGTSQLYKNKDWLYHQNIELNKTFVEIANEFGFNVSTLKKWARKHELPKKGTGYFHIGHAPWNKGIADQRQVDALRKYHHCGKRQEGYLKVDSVKYRRHKKDFCEICGTYEINSDVPLQVHHKDEDRNNNTPDNLITLCNKCHQRVHNKNLLTAYPDTVVLIEDAEEQEVFDIEMKSDNHNFVANGIVVHNCNYSKDKFGKEITVIKPTKQMLNNSQAAYEVWSEAMKNAEKSYLWLLNLGVAPEIARTVLPNGLKTEIVMTADLREWRHFLKLRAAGITGIPHPQMSEVAIPLLEKCKELMPEIFGDIEVTE